ncbi:PREDICTED: uncharacterized protein LOC109231090 [Nicotiana attenuata]|uniref:uncharacterized protein LOC109231090 n=1 Tax=Nicotiana attenuata TaxID=49451 RepID=UPI0009057FF4|nr:PREDICTED: uncharacterized protein LOC109231090 [Nicotiana attenuata]
MSSDLKTKRMHWIRRSLQATTNWVLQINYCKQEQFRAMRTLKSILELIWSKEDQSEVSSRKRRKKTKGRNILQVRGPSVVVHWHTHQAEQKAICAVHPRLRISLRGFYFKGKIVS